MIWLSKGEDDHRSPPVCNPSRPSTGMQPAAPATSKPAKNHPHNGCSSPSPPAPVLTASLHPTTPAKQQHHALPSRRKEGKLAGKPVVSVILILPQSLIHSICFSPLFICFSSTALNQGGNSSLTNIYRLSNHNCSRRQGQ